MPEGPDGREDDPRSIIEKRPDNYRLARKAIRALWDRGATMLLPHAIERMETRKIDAQDLRSVVRGGDIVHHEYGKAGWRYRLRGSTVDGRLLDVVVEVAGLLLIVTVIDVTR